MANGGIIGTVNTPTSTTATGVWQQEEQYEAKVTDTWPQRALFTTNSCRFNDGSSDYLNRTPSSAGNRRTWTWSAWVKRSNLGGEQNLLAADNSNRICFETVDSADQFALTDTNTSTIDVVTNQVFRDVSAFYHLVVAFDSTQGTAANRVKLYVNGSQVTSLARSTYPTQNGEFSINNNSAQYIGRNSGGSNYFDGYMSEVIFVDGQQLAPTSFGVANSDGVWTPIPYTGTFGTNGFNLQFQNSAALGTDSSPNGNTFTVNNLTSIDQSTDYPEVNYCTMNPLHSGAVTFAEGNLQVSRSGSGQSWLNSLSTFAPTSGKWYVEIKVNSVGSNGLNMGFANFDLSNLQNVTSGPGEDATSAGLYSNGGPIFYASGTTFATVGSPSGIMQLAMDLDNGFLYWGKNGTWLNSANPESGATGTGGLALTNLSSGGSYGIALAARNGGDVSFNFGSPPFAISSGNTDGDGYGNFEYAVPSGYFSLNTKNLAEYG